MLEFRLRSVPERLFAKGADVSYHDPFVPKFTTAVGTMYSVPFTPETIAASDVVVIITDHTTVAYGDLLEHGQLIVDTRNALKGHEDSKIVRL